MQGRANVGGTITLSLSALPEDGSSWEIMSCSPCDGTFAVSHPSQTEPQTVDIEVPDSQASCLQVSGDVQATSTSMAIVFALDDTCSQAQDLTLLLLALPFL